MRSKKYQDYEIDESLTERYGQDEERTLPGAEALEEIKEDKSSVGSVLFSWLKEILIAVVIAAIVLQFIKPTIVKQRSMEPNFHSNDYVLVSKQSYKILGGTPELGDVIIFDTSMKSDEGDDKILIKRVIGVPGDVVSIHDGKVYLNGDELSDSYTKDQYTNGDMEETVVPENSLFCLGDNRAVSVDSRSSEIGFISMDSVIGKAVFRLFPFSVMGPIENPYK